MIRSRFVWKAGLAVWVLGIETGSSCFLVFPLLVAHLPAPVLRCSDRPRSHQSAPQTSVSVNHFPRR